MFVAWTDVATTNVNFSTIKLARSCAGGATFPNVIDVAGPVNASYPQVMVDNVNNRIYVLYLNHGARTLQMATVIDGTNCTDWPALFATEDVTGARNLITDLDPAANQLLNRQVRAITTPVARFNFAARRIGVVWHERESANSTLTDAYISTKSLNVGGTWTAPKILTDQSGQDQFMPALDSEPSGNWVVSFYNRADDVNNVYYRSYYRAFSPDGQTPLTTPEAWISSIQYDPEWQPSNQDGGLGFIGDYQDIWQWTFLGGNSRWNAAWIRTSPSDNMVSIIK